MKSKYWAIALGLLIILMTLVSACGGKKETTTATATATATKTATATATTTSTATKTATATATATATKTATATATQTATATATGNTLGNILGLGAGITNVKYDETMTVSGSQTVTATVYMKDYKKFREEMTTQGMRIVILMDMDTGVMYTYYPDTNTAMKMTFNPSTEAPQGAVGDPNNILQYNPQITGTETIDGKSCTVMTWDIPGTGTMKEWIWTDKGFPLKIETSTAQGTSTIEYQ